MHTKDEANLLLSATDAEIKTSVGYIARMGGVAGNGYAPSYCYFVINSVVGSNLYFCGRSENVDE